MCNWMMTNSLRHSNNNNCSTFWPSAVAGPKKPEQMCFIRGVSFHLGRRWGLARLMKSKGRCNKSHQNQAPEGRRVPGRGRSLRKPNAYCVPSGF
jgi:hypothetical protein